MLNSRRVRKVHLTGSSEDLIRRGALLLEDALHTASIPASEGRVLVVRSLHIGDIHPNSSPAGLSLAIEQRLREAVPVHASNPAAHLREAVYFHDDVEPSILLALRLARRESTHAWFWRLAVPAWKPEMSPDDAMRTIFFNLTRAKAGLAAAIRLAAELGEQNALDPLLTALRPQDGTGLMRAFGWSKHPKAAESPVNTSMRWQQILSRWIPRWRRDDARILWLAGVALAADNPLRLLDNDLMIRAGGVIENIANMNKRAHSSAPLQTPLNESRVGADLRPALPEDHVPDARTARRVAPTDTPGDVGAWRAMPTQNIAPTPQLNIDSSDAQNSENRQEEFSDDVETSPVGAHSDQRKSLWDRAPLFDTETGVEQGFVPAPSPDTPLETEHAGLFFLIPVLTRLGIAEFLTPELIESEFPFHLLRHIGQHLGLPDVDPINDVLATDAPYDPQANFVTPESWRKSIVSPGEPILRRSGEKNVLFDSSGRLALAAWDNVAIGSKPTTAGNPNPLKGLISESKSPFSDQRKSPRDGLDLSLAEGFEPSAAKTSRDLLRHAWLTATRRWLRRNAYMGLADVVLRPGRIAATRTHIDLFFDLSQANICVRRVGLDIDPGWVSWLGRVVTFHYGEQTA